MLIQVEIASFAVEPGRNTPLIILKECGGERIVPVSIGPYEASAIAIKSLNVVPDKPLTVDLVKLTIDGLGASVHSAVIYAVKNESLLARMQIRSAQGALLLLECSPSDALSLALRCEVPVFVSEQVFDSKHQQDQDSAAQLLSREIREKDTLEFGRYFLE